MNLFDPARGERRTLFWNGKPVGVVPSIQFTPRPPGVCGPEIPEYLAEVCIVIAPSTGRWLEATITNPNQLLLDFAEDPENVLQEYFCWRYNASAKPVNSRGLTLADLGEL